MVYYALGKRFFTLIHVVSPFSKGIKFLNFPFGEIAIKKASNCIGNLKLNTTFEFFFEVFYCNYHGCIDEWDHCGVLERRIHSYTRCLSDHLLGLAERL